MNQGSKMKTDIEIANLAHKKPIEEIADSLGLVPEEFDLYGKYKAKIDMSVLKRLETKPNGKLVLVTAISPTPAGEGKTTMTVGLGQGMAKIGKSAVVCLREPSLGPVFGIKGGAAGGGYSQVLPMDEINLHFTGDFHAITSANNLLCAMIDNHIMQGNNLNINPKRILFPRCLDMNDRVLRNVIVGLGSRVDGVTRQDSFMITVASEIMAVLCLAESVRDLKEKLGNILVAYTYDNKPVYCRDIKAQGAMAALLKEALKPNLVQSTENTPCIIHGGPFANIAHGCNSVLATKTALKLGDYCITEAGFGADLGAEKFFDIKCRKSGLTPNTVVLVATVRALKYNGGVARDRLKDENVQALIAGCTNLKTHVENLKGFGVPVVVCINHFYADTDKEISALSEYCTNLGVKAVVAKSFEKGGDGAIELATAVAEACEIESEFEFAYPEDLPIVEKIDRLAKNIYRAGEVVFGPGVKEQINEIETLGYGKLPVCMAKTQYSFSDNPALLGSPTGFSLTVREVRVSAGAGFIVVITGNIMTMPGLPKQPSAEMVDINDESNIIGLF